MAPDTVAAHPARVTLIDSCPKPYVMLLTNKVRKNRELPGKGNARIVSLMPPAVTPVDGGVWGGLAYIQNINTEDGLALSGIASVYSDRAGNMWFGTYGGGVNRFDGKKFTNYTTANGLAGNVVTSILEDSKGNYWFATNGKGISRFNGKYFRNYSSKDGLANNKVLKIAEDASGNIWFGTDEGASVFSYENNKNEDSVVFTNFTDKDGLVSNNLISMAPDKNGEVWIGTVNGVSRFVPDKRKPLIAGRFFNYTQEQGLISNVTRSMLIDNAGNIWAGTEGGVNKFIDNNQNKGSGRFLAYPCFPKTSVIWMVEDVRGGLWMSTGDEGIIKFNPDRAPDSLVTYFREHQGFANKLVYSGDFDKQGNLWLGTYGRGIVKYCGEAVVSFAQEQGLLFDKVWSTIEDENHNIWFGTSSGLSMYNNKSFVNYSRLRETSHAIRDIIKDRNNNLWYASRGGLTMYDGSSFITYTVEQGLSHNSVLSLYEDSKGNIWCGSYGSGVSVFDGKKITTFTAEEGLLNNVVKCVAEDKNGNIWLGTNDGVSIFDGSHFINYSAKQGFPDNAVYDLLRDRNGDIWLGTAGGGVCRFSGSTFKTYTVADGLADNVVYALAEDTINNIMWIGTNQGLSALHLDNTDSESNKVHFENFNTRTGYPIKDINTGSLFLDSKGILWAGTGEKLVRFDYKEVHRYSKPLVAVLKGLKVQSQNIGWHTLKVFKNKGSGYTSVPDSLTVINEEIGTFTYALSTGERVKMNEKFGDIAFDSVSPHFFIPQHLVLPYKNNNLTFEFGTIETGKPQLVRYQYMLEGYNSDWSSVTDETSATFGNIQEGVYTLLLKVQNPDGIWSTPLSYTFRVLPPWYRTWWMYVLYALAAVFLFLSLLWLNSRRLRLRAKELTDEVQKATSEIRQQKKAIEEQKLIVEEKNKDILDSIHYARRIQDALLRDEEYVSLHLPDHFILYLPKDIVSGDFYWGIEKKYEVVPGKTEHFWYVAAVDCTGHGVPGAFMSMLGTVFLNDIVNDNKPHTPAAILDELRNKVVKELGQTGKRDESKDGMDISLIRLNLNSLELEWAGANNSLNIVSNGELTEVKADKQPIGYYPESKPFTNHSIQLKKGDYIYLFTDGYADQFGGPKGKKFKYKQLEQLLVSNVHLPLHQQKATLKKMFNEWKGELPQVDDVCIIGIKV